jgi:hypothetical protein
MPKKQSIKTLILKSQYVTEDFEDTKDRMSSYRESFYKDFPEEYKKMLEAQNKASEEQGGVDSEGEEEDLEEYEIDENEPKSETMRKLYRRITKITHPDKVESEFLTSYFQKASTAYSDNDVGTLFTIAATLDIDVSDIDSEDIAQELEDSITNKRMNTMMMKGSLAWMWAHAETEEEKDKVRAIVEKHTKENY